jgi:FtsP/CotA-like multicopper oxidase with cupredoxin domain
MKLGLGILLLAACAPKPIPVGDIHDNTHPVGNRVGDTVTVTFEPQRAMWYPETTTDPGAEVWGISADGATPMIPGPLLRGDAATVFSVTIRNPSDTTLLRAYGFGTRPGGGEAIVIAPGLDTTITFAAGAPGSYFYSFGWGAESDGGTPADESLLAGALVIDSLGITPNDQVFLTSSWFVEVDSAQGEPYVPRDWMVINGRSFPHNGTIEMQQGDTARWRWINASEDAHPIHLHGDHFRVTRIGDMTADSDHWGQEVVTQLLTPGSTFSAIYVPTEPGNWLIHCHFAFHTSHFLSTDRVSEAGDMGGPEAVDHSLHGMKGMLIPIKVTPRTGGIRRIDNDPAARQMRIIVQGKPAVGDEPEWFGYIPVNGAEPARDSVPALSPILVLNRGESVAITVVNRLRAPTALHWHGLELPSWSDGVPGWSGGLPDTAKGIAVGDSFVARFTPPRAGTFIYHAHSNELYQIGSGLYGALLVVDPATYQPERERVVVLGGAGFFSETARVNGKATPDPIRIPAGVPIRFRLVSMHIDYRISAQLQRDSTTMPWRMIAKDGADLPLIRQVTDTMPWLAGPGETADFEVVLETPGEYILMMKHVFDDWAVPVRVVVSRGT